MNSLADNSPVRLFPALPLLCGFMATGVQIILLREFLVLCGGNELTIGCFFGGWLLFGAIGSAAGSAVKHGDEKTLGASLAALSLLLILASFWALWMLKGMRGLLGLNPGEALSVGQALLAVLWSLLPANVLLGACFAMSCVLRSRTGTAAAGPLRDVYLFDSLGSLLAGVAVSLVLILFLDGAQSLCVLAGSGFMLISSFILCNRWPARRHVIWVAPLWLGTGAFVLVMAGHGATLSRMGAGRAWAGYEVEAVRDSLYGNILLLKRGEQRSLVYNGNYLASSDVNDDAAALAHLTLLQHPDPKRVLLIGGAPTGLVPEILKHPVARLDVLEPDALLVAMSRHCFPEKCAGRDSRVAPAWISTDARLFLRCSPATYDVIILNLSDPSTIQTGRYFSVEFFRQVRAALADHGVFSFAVSGDDSYLNPPARRYLHCFQTSLKAVFGNVTVIPGYSFLFLAGVSSDVPSNRPGDLGANLAARNVASALVNADFIARKCDPVRVAFFLEQISREDTAGRNTDLAPVISSLYLDYWRQKFDLRVRATEFAGTRDLLLFLLLLAAAGGLTFARFAKGPAAVMPLVLVNGLNGIALCLLTLIAFQIFFGSLYFGCGFLSALFMLGLSLGSLYAMRTARSGGPARRPLFTIQTLIPLLFLVFPALVAGSAHLALGRASLAAGAAVFGIVALAGGFLVAAQFLLLCGSAEPATPERGPRTGGLLYACDLAGGGIGALLITPLAIPRCGIWDTCLGFALLNLALLPALRLLLRRRL